MLYINFKGNIPQQRFYSLGVQRNNKANKIRFILDKQQADLNLSDYVCSLKIENKESKYLDLIMLEKVNETETELVYEWVMPLKSTQYRNLELQLEFLGDEEIVWQTMIIGIELSDTIKVGETVDEKELSVLKQMEYQVGKNKEDIADLDKEVKKAKEIIIGDPNDYLNENGLDKIIRQQDENGNIQKSYMIDKIVTLSTLVVCEQHREENGFKYCENDGEETFVEKEAFVEDLGRDNFNAIFGGDFNFDIGSLSSFVSSLYYNRNGVITKGVVFSSEDRGYVGIDFYDVEPQKEITIVVGKYFEYDENGNKVFDDNASIYSEHFATEGQATRAITEEKQTFIFKANEDGYLYFDNDGGDLDLPHSRFILYAIETGEPEHIEYEAKEIGAGVLSLPAFRQTQTMQELIDFYNEYKDVYGANGCMGFVLLPDYEWYDSTYICTMHTTNENFLEVYLTDKDGVTRYSGPLGDIADDTPIYEELLDNHYEYYPYVFESQLPNEWYGTQQAYDALPTKRDDTTYNIYED